MSFKKGHKKKGGRSKGTQNIITSEIKEMINTIITSEIQVIPDLLKDMQPEKRVELTIKLLSYVLPKPDKNIKIENKQTEQPIFLNVSNNYSIDKKGNSIPN